MARGAALTRPAFCSSCSLSARDRGTAMATDACYPFLGMCFSTKIDLGLIVSVAIFIAGLYVSRRTENRIRKAELDDREKKEFKARRRYLLALREEIGLNIESLDKSVNIFPPKDKLYPFMRKDKNNRPLITFTFYSVIFKTRTEILQDLPDTLIKNIVDFYGKLDEIEIDIASIGSDAFVVISDDGREATLDAILTQQKIALQQGKGIRDSISLHLNDTA
jgi:hypothetical protein